MTLVYVPKGSGLQRVRVCGACEKRGITIVPVEPAARCTCGELATTCGKCLDKTADKAKRGTADAKALAKKLRLRAHAYEREPSAATPYQEGLAAGLEQAADYLEKGAW